MLLASGAMLCIRTLKSVPTYETNDFHPKCFLFSEDFRSNNCTVLVMSYEWRIADDQLS